jgi:hypothetical protein
MAHSTLGGWATDSSDNDDLNPLAASTRPADNWVVDEVEQFRQEHDEARECGCHAKDVGEVIQQDEAGHDRIGRGREGADAEGDVLGRR